MVESFTNLANFCRHVDTEYFLKKKPSAAASATDTDKTDTEVTESIPPEDEEEEDDMIEDDDIEED